ncbi:glycosyltransferase family 2 protein [Pelagibius sp.]|uniref:glycosyltransferase family 2 protein n=1 Tax=Pelagibius sp. TaxID=1931238 RepID=UPI003B50FF4A
MTPIVSVILPAYNAAESIPRALDSLLLQSLQSFEVLVVDDASADGTADTVAGYAKVDPRIVLVRRDENAGAAAARNIGFACARGKWVALLDADDAYTPGRLEGLVDLGERGEADIVADNLRFVSHLGEAAPRPALPAGHPAFQRPVSAAAYVRSNLFLTRGFKLGYLKPMFRRRFLERHGLRQNGSLRIAEDYHFCLDALLCGARFLLSPEAGYLYTQRPGSLSRSLTLDDLRQLSTANRLDLLRATPQGGADLRAALHRRQISVDLNVKFMQFVDALKGRRVGDAGAIFASNPDLTPHLAFYGLQSLRKRLPGGNRIV